MINLLPPNTREDMLYARRNTHMLKWLIVLAMAALGVVIIVFSGLIYLDRAAESVQKSTSANQESLKNQKLPETQKQVEDISSNIKLTTQVLSKEILFSKLLLQLGSALPDNTSLSQLQIDKLQGGISLTAAARDIDSATQLQINLEDPKNQIFQKADIENISCDPGSANVIYPCTVQIRALFANNNPFLYISPAQTTTGGQKP